MRLFPNLPPNQMNPNPLKKIKERGATETIWKRKQDDYRVNGALQILGGPVGGEDKQEGQTQDVNVPGVVPGWVRLAR